MLLIKKLTNDINDLNLFSKDCKYKIAIIEAYNTNYNEYHISKLILLYLQSKFPTLNQKNLSKISYFKFIR